MATKTQIKPAPRAVPQHRADPEPKSTSRALATAENAGPPAHVLARMEEDAGKGVSSRQEDNLVPLVYLLQANSPQCLRGSPQYLDGAAAGYIWLRGLDEFVDGEEGGLFQPCWFSVDWVEWMPDRGGFVGRHATRPAEAVLQDRERDDGSITQVWTLPNGNIVQETRYHVGYFLRDDGDVPYTIPFTSTGHTVSKAWMFTMNSQRLPNGKTMPACGAVYRLKTKLRSKNDWNWYQYDVKHERYASVEEYDRGIALHDAFAAGAKKVEDFDADPEAGGIAAGQGDDNI